MVATVEDSLDVWLVAVTVVYSIFGALFLVALAAGLAWLALRQWTRSSDRFAARNFDGSPVVGLLLLEWATISLFAGEVYDAFLELAYDLTEVIMTRYGVILTLICLAVGATIVADEQTNLMTIVDVGYNQYFCFFLEKVYYPLFNALRLAYDAAIPAWNTISRLSSYVGWNLLTTVLTCGLEDVTDFILNLVILITETIETIVAWVEAGALDNPIDTVPVWSALGRLLERMGIFFRCNCRDLEKLWNLLVYFWTEPVSHHGANQVINAALQVPQQIGLVIRDGNITVEPFSDYLCNGLVNLGRGVDGVFNKTYWDLVELIPGDRPFNGSHTLPEFVCAIPRAACVFIKAFNSTGTLIIKAAEGEFRPGMIDTRTIFREWNDTARCVRGFSLAVVDFFDMEKLPPLATTVKSLGGMVDQTIRFLSVPIYFAIDFVQIVVQSAVMDENFFDVAQAYYDAGNLEMLYTTISLFGRDVGQILDTFFQPLQELFYSSFRLVSALLRVVVQFSFFINQVFTKSAYLRSPAMNATINEAFVQAMAVTRAVGDFSRYIGVEISMVEVEDLLSDSPTGNPPVAQLQNILNSTTEGLNAVEKLDWTVYQYIDVTTPDGRHEYSESCKFIKTYFTRGAVPYWGWLFCAAGDTIDIGLNVFVLLGREVVIIVQAIVPPESVGAMIEGLEDFLMDLDSSLRVFIDKISDTISFTDWFASIFGSTTDSASPRICVYTDEDNLYQPDATDPRCPAKAQEVRNYAYSRSINGIVTLIRLPLTILILFFEAGQNQGVFAACSNVGITTTTNSTYAERGFCVQVWLTQFVFDPFYEVTNATSHLANYLNCVAPGLGNPLASLTCSVHFAITELQDVFINAFMLTLDLIAFFADASLDNLTNVIYDAADLLYDFFKAIVDIIWDEILAPFHKKPIQFSYAMCMQMQSTYLSSGFGLGNVTLNCTQIFLDFQAEINDTQGTIDKNAQWWIQSPPPFPSMPAFARQSYENYIRSVAASPMPSNTPSITPTISVSPSSTPSTSPSITPTQTPSPGSMFFRKREKGDEDDKDVDYAKEKTKERLRIRFVEESEDFEEVEWSEEREEKLPSSSEEFVRDLFSRPTVAEIDARKQTVERHGFESMGEGLFPPNWWEFETRPTRESSKETLERFVRWVEEGKMIDVPLSGGTYYPDVDYDAQDLEEDHGSFVHRDDVPPLNKRHVLRMLDWRVLDEDVLSHLTGETLRLVEIENDRRKARNARNRLRGAKIRHRDLGGRRYFRRNLFNDRDFPGGIWHLTDQQDLPYAELNVRPLALIEERIDFRGYYEASSLRTKRVIDGVRNLASSSIASFFKLREGLRVHKFWEGMEKAEKALYSIKFKPSLHNKTLSNALGDAYHHRVLPRIHDLIKSSVRHIESRSDDMTHAVGRFAGPSALSLVKTHVRKKRETPLDRKLLRDCAILDQSVEILLQQACIFQDYFSVGGMFQYQFESFRNWTVNPLNYTPTVYPKDALRLNCSYVKAGAKIFGYNNPNNQIPFPNLNLTLARGRNRTAKFCDNPRTPTLACRVRQFMNWLDFEIDRFTDDLMEALFGQGSKKGVPFYLENITTCNYATNLMCHNPDSIGPEDALIVVFTVLLAISIYHFFFARIPLILIGYGIVALPLYLLLAYGYSPVCLPSLPYCLADDLFDVWVRVFRVCIEWPDCLCKKKVPPPVNTTISCGSCDEFYDALQDLNIRDGLDNLAIFLNHYAPGWTRALMHDKWLRPIYSIPFVREHVLKFYFAGRGVPLKYVCGAWVTVFNIFQVVLVGMLFFCFSPFLTTVAIQLGVFLYASIWTMVSLIYMFVSQISVGFVERFDGDRTML